MRGLTAVFLVIDFEQDNRFLLVKTLRRHFPGAIIQECEEAEPALMYLRNRSVTAVVTHRSSDTAPMELVRQLHDAEPTVPIVVVSGTESAESALAAGASAFLHYDDWPRIGEVMRLMLRAAKADAPASG